MEDQKPPHEGAIDEYGYSIAELPRECIECDAGCGKKSPYHMCAGCYCTFYCSRKCQKKHWSRHKSKCKDRAKTLKEIKNSTSSSLLLPPFGGGTSINKECSICMEIPSDPFVLPSCKHTFCFDCLSEWQQRRTLAQLQAGPENDASRQCPYCRSDAVDLCEVVMSRAMSYMQKADQPGRTTDDKDILHKEAMTCIEKLVGTKNPDLRAYKAKAELMINLNKPKEAIQALVAFENKNEERRRAMRPIHELFEQMALAQQYGDVYQIAEMQRVIEAMVEQNGGVPEGPIDVDKAELKALRAEALMLKGQWEQALNQLKEGKRHAGQSFVADRKLFTLLSQCHYKLGNHKKAVSAGQTAIGIDRHYAGVHRWTALALKDMGKIEEAIKVANEAVLYETPWDVKNRGEVIRLYLSLGGTLDASPSE